MVSKLCKAFCESLGCSTRKQDYLPLRYVLVSASRFMLILILAPLDSLPATHHKPAASWSHCLFCNNRPSIDKTGTSCNLRDCVSSQLRRSHDTDRSGSTMAYLYRSSSLRSVSSGLRHFTCLVPRLPHQVLQMACTLTQPYYT